MGLIQPPKSPGLGTNTTCSSVSCSMKEVYPGKHGQTSLVHAAERTVFSHTLSENTAEAFRPCTCTGRSHSGGPGHRGLRRTYQVLLSDNRRDFFRRRVFSMESRDLVLYLRFLYFGWRFARSTASQSRLEGHRTRQTLNRKTRDGRYRWANRASRGLRRPKDFLNWRAGRADGIGKFGPTGFRDRRKSCC